jgi:hypothetical protein
MQCVIERWSRRLFVVLAITAASACGIQSNTYHGNGQLLVLPGGHDKNNEREGVWVYFNEDGSVKLVDDQIDGVTYERTGVYEHGHRVRMPIDAELQSARVEAERMTNEFRKH